MIASLIFQASSLISFFLSTYLLLLLVFFGYLEIAAEGFVIISFTNIFTHGLSANIRNIYLGSKSFANINAIIKFRIILAIALIALVIFIIFFTTNTANYIFYLSLTFLVIVNWILELVIAKYEKSNFTLNSFFFLQLLLVIFSTAFIFFNNLTLLSFFIIIYCIIIFYYLIKTYLKNLNLDLQNKKIHLTLGLLSSFSKQIANFAWRFFLVLLVGKNQSSVLLLAFSLGSLFVTIFDISYGAKWIKKIQNKNFFINSFFIFYVLVCLGVLFIFQLFSRLDDNQYALFQSTIIFSLLGAYFLIVAMKKRQIMYENKLVRKVCYNSDIITYAFNFCIIPFLYYWNVSYLNLSYLVSSIFCYIVYTILFNHYVYRKKKFF
jgi:hypothetical protein